ncbi:MAG: PTS sugar transporter subunit IIB [Tissierellaceae bacterium]|jgi:PTS system mannose-specific IIB component|nr:PTS sugar transporter subunit IIB [Tissierellaceae bacterium]
MIVLSRIDDRLIHGQVMTSWLNVTGANKIVIVDNATAKDTFMKSILSSVVPANIKIDILTIDESIPVLKNYGDSKDKVILLVKEPNAILELVENGIPLKNVNIGGMGVKPGRNKLYKNIYASKEERETLKKLIQREINVQIRIIAEDNAVDIEKYL